MHAEPPVYHRDVRRENIIKRTDSDDWFLIDFADASTAPTEAAHHLNWENHSPRIQQNGHGAEVDIWGIAHYMCQLLKVVNNRQYVEEMAKRWKGDTALTAETALAEIEVGTPLYHCNILIFGAASKTALLYGGCGDRDVMTSHVAKCVTINHIPMILTPAWTTSFCERNPDSVKRPNPCSITTLCFSWSTVMPDQTYYIKSRYHALRALFNTEMLEIGLEVWTAVAVAVRGELSTCMRPK